MENHKLDKIDKLEQETGARRDETKKVKDYYANEYSGLLAKPSVSESESRADETSVSHLPNVAELDEESANSSYDISSRRKRKIKITSNSKRSKIPRKHEIPESDDVDSSDSSSDTSEAGVDKYVIKYMRKLAGRNKKAKREVSAKNDFLREDTSSSQDSDCNRKSKIRKFEQSSGSELSYKTYNSILDSFGDNCALPAAVPTLSERFSKAKAACTYDASFEHKNDMKQSNAEGYVTGHLNSFCCQEVMAEKMSQVGARPSSSSNSQWNESVFTKFKTATRKLRQQMFQDHPS